MKHYGDITKISGYEVPIVDIVTGGSPCQDLSLAGKRAGLNGERSGLFMEQIRLIKEMRDADRKRGAVESARPRFMVWENVPGAFSSNNGEDFRVVLEETARIADENAVIPGLAEGQKWSHSGSILGDGWSIAWRVHDAQFWGVPQRRKRISLIADFGGWSAAEILFERKGMSGDSEQSRTEREETAGAVGTGIEETGTTKVLSTEHHAVAVENHPSDSRVKISKDGTVQTLSGRMETGGNNVPLVMESINGEIAGTLDANYYKGCGERNGIEREVVCIGNGQLNQLRMMDTVGTLNCMHDQQAILTVGALCADDYKDPNRQYVDAGKLQVTDSIVRRLTPLECERLQGYPDGWTDIGEWIDSKGKKHKDSDSVRYKALGNSIALPFWQWMAERMVKYIDHDPTMASLFDGIGGFPYVYQQVGCKPVWASEIEEFPMAVTKIRFPEEEGDM